MVSVIITTYNRPDMLQQAIDSVIAQKSCQKEIIVIDDNSTMDNSFCIPFVSKYIKNTVNKGLGENHKIGFYESTGEYVCFMDDDDYYTDMEFFFNAITRFEEDSQITMVCASSNSVYEPSLRMEPVLLNNPEMLSNLEFLRGFGVKYRKPQSTFTTIFRKKSLIKAGFEKMAKPTDTCLYLRALIADGKVCFVNKCIGNYRIHEIQMTKEQNPDFIIDVLREKKEILNIVKNRLLSPNEWMYNQFRITFDYYCASYPFQQDLNKVLNWSLTHYTRNLMLLRYLLKIWFENNIFVRHLRKVS
jgi:glycosyltransferase involved in cell wall biosynthesis